MRIKHAIFVGSMTGLVVIATPVLAKNSGAHKTDDKSASSSCHAYQQAPDGSWTELPCAETGSGVQAQRKSATRSPDQEAR